MTKALRTILDVWQEESPPETSLRDAFEDAKHLGRLDRSEIAQARTDPQDCAAETGATTKTGRQCGSGPGLRTPGWQGISVEGFGKFLTSDIREAG